MDVFSAATNDGKPKSTTHTNVVYGDQSSVTTIQPGIPTSSSQEVSEGLSAGVETPVPSQTEALGSPSAVVPTEMSNNELPPRRNSTHSNFLVSEHEEDYTEDEDGIRSRNTTTSCAKPLTLSDGSSAVVGNVSVENTMQTIDDADAPTEIPPEDGDDDDGEEDDSDYEYDYEDEDESHYSGFLISDPHPALSSVQPASVPAPVPQENPAAGGSGPDRVQDEEGNSSAAADTTAAAGSTSESPLGKKSKWREPTRAAVSMSLRAEKEKTGGKRRLASDLYKVMMADTNEAGFSLEPKSEDSMDKWTIKLFKFDEDSNLAKDLLCLGMDFIELEMSFPEQYPFEPPFVRVVRPRFKRQTGFVMNGALCMELLTSEGWNPINDIESVIVSIRSLLVVGDGRLAAAAEMSDEQRESIIAAARERKAEAADDDDDSDEPSAKRQRRDSDEEISSKGKSDSSKGKKPVSKAAAGHYTTSEARDAYTHLSDYHKKKGWDTSGWWAQKG